MSKLLSSFYSRLSLALLASFVLVGMLLLVLAEQLTQNYQNEVEQKLHLELAEQVVQHNRLLNDGEIDGKALERAFHSMMILGPSFEFYVLDPQGNVTTYSAAPGKIKRQQVDLGPIQQFLSGQVILPIVNDDPRSEDRRKIFSVAEIKDGNELKGYLYIIIGGEIYDSVVDLLQDSHIVELSVWGLVALLLFSLAVMLLLFAMLTRPLRRLAQDMQKFREDGFEQGQLNISDWNRHSNDEIHRLGTTFVDMAAALQQQYQKVKDTDELRREMISYVSHDLRTPLASLQGYLETWQLKKDDLSEADGERLIQVAMNNARQMSRMVEQLFELAHLDGDNVKLIKEPVAVAELAQDVLQKLSLEAQNKNVRLDLEPKDPSLRVMADIEKLERVLTNLVDNAIRHCQAGDEVRVEMIPCPSNQTEQLEIRVIDTGIGIRADELPHLFDPHYRASNTIKDKGGHSGLGLAIAKRILELHDADIKVHSQLGEGTTFSFLLQCP